MKQTPKPNYYAVLTADVRYDKELPDKAKLIYAEISALSNKTGQCWASDTYFAKLYSCTRQTVNSNISILKDKGYIVIFGEREKRMISIQGVVKKILQGCQENLTRSCQENLTHNSSNKDFKDLDLNNKINKRLDEKEHSSSPKFNNLGYFMNIFKEKRGLEYIGKPAKDGKLLKTLRTRISEDEYKSLLTRFFNSDNDFIKKSDYGVGMFVSQIDRLRAEKLEEEPQQTKRVHTFDDEKLLFDGRKLSASDYALAKREFGGNR